MKKNILFLTLGVFIGIVSIITARAANYKEEYTHYHANFAVFVDGNRVEFNDKKYSEETILCSVDKNLSPKQRVHLHEQNQDVVHVHHDAVTWGHFFMNIGFNIGDSYLIDDKNRIFQKSSEKPLFFILNGKVVDSIYNRKIGDQDRLLVNFGIENQDEILKRSEETVLSNASEYNAKNDPASCGGHQTPSFIERLKKSIF
jgi:hypothetical protein